MLFVFVTLQNLGSSNYEIQCFRYLRGDLSSQLFNFFLILAGSLVFWLLYMIIVYFNTCVNLNKSQIFTHSSILEIVCTIFSVIVLLIIAAPSLPKNLDVILFFIAAVCGLINSAHCYPDVDETFTSETTYPVKSFQKLYNRGFLFSGGLRPLAGVKSLYFVCCRPFIRTFLGVLQN